MLDARPGVHAPALVYRPRGLLAQQVWQHQMRLRMPGALAEVCNSWLLRLGVCGLPAAGLHACYGAAMDRVAQCWCCLAALAEGHVQCRAALPCAQSCASLPCRSGRVSSKRMNTPEQRRGGRICTSSGARKHGRSICQDGVHPGASAGVCRAHQDCHSPLAPQNTSCACLRMSVDGRCAAAAAPAASGLARSRDLEKSARLLAQCSPDQKFTVQFDLDKACACRMLATSTRSEHAHA